MKIYKRRESKGEKNIREESPREKKYKRRGSKGETLWERRQVGKVKVETVRITHGKRVREVISSLRLRFLSFIDFLFPIHSSLSLSLSHLFLHFLQLSFSPSLPLVSHSYFSLSFLVTISFHSLSLSLSFSLSILILCECGNHSALLADTMTDLVLSFSNLFFLSFSRLICRFFPKRGDSIVRVMGPIPIIRSLETTHGESDF